MAYMKQFKKFGLIITNANCVAVFKKVSILPRSPLMSLSLSNVMATLARARTAATGSSSVVDLAFDVVPPPV